MYTFIDNPRAIQKGQFNIQLTRSAVGKEKPALLSEEAVPKPVNVYYPDSVLESFRQVIKNSGLAGQKFYNPYTEEVEQFPEHFSEFTARHLQLLARNESSNVSGMMEVDLYGKLLTDDQIARIRCLVKGTVIVGQVTATHMNGYGRKAEPLKKTEDVILIDQAGLQWQGDLRNSGGMFFYPDATEKGKIPQDYAQWQNDMYAHMYGASRPLKATKGSELVVQWAPSLDSDVTIRGTLDLDGVRLGIMSEFQQALSGLVDYSRTLPPDANPINFKYLKAGMGFFCEGLHDPELNISFTGLQNDGLAQLELARLNGVLSALKSYPTDTDFGTVRRLSLPFSGQLPWSASPDLIGRYQQFFDNIQKECKRLNLEWGGAKNEDALMPTPGYTNALTNCADPHAQIGNEGKYSSVDAAISSNIPHIHLLNAAYNPFIQGRSLTSVSRPAEEMVASSSYRSMGQSSTSDHRQHFFAHQPPKPESGSTEEKKDKSSGPQ